VNEWFLAGRGESLGSRKGVGEVLLLRWILRDVPGGSQGSSFPLRLTTDQELMPTRGIRLFNLNKAFGRI